MARPALTSTYACRRAGMVPGTIETVLSLALSLTDVSSEPGSSSAVRALRPQQ